MGDVEDGRHTSAHGARGFAAPFKSKQKAGAARDLIDRAERVGRLFDDCGDVCVDQAMPAVPVRDGRQGKVDDIVICVEDQEQGRVCAATADTARLGAPVED